MNNGPSGDDLTYAYSEEQEKQQRKKEKAIMYTFWAILAISLVFIVISGWAYILVVLIEALAAWLILVVFGDKFLERKFFRALAFAAVFVVIAIIGASLGPVGKLIAFILGVFLWRLFSGLGLFGAFMTLMLMGVLDYVIVMLLSPLFS